MSCYLSAQAFPLGCIVQGHRALPFQSGCGEEKIHRHSSTLRFQSSPLELTLFQDAYHELFNEIDDVPQQVVNEIVAFVNSHLPSAAAADSTAELAPAESVELEGTLSSDPPKSRL